MKTVSHAQALEVLKTRPSTFASFRTCTEQTVLNKGRGDKAMVAVLGIDPDKIMKIASFNALVGTKVDYQTLVQNRELRSVEGLESPTFEAEERKWGKRIDGVEVGHDGKRYVTLHCVAANKPKVEYTYEGQPIDLTDAKFDPWRKPAKVEGAKQVAHGIEKPVVYRDFGIESIMGFSVGGEQYQLEG